MIWYNYENNGSKCKGKPPVETRITLRYKQIDFENWNRKEYFEHYYTAIPCTYSMTVQLDITKVKASGQKLYPALLYLLTKVVNRHEEFRTSMNAEGQVIVFEDMHPCYTVFHAETETFSNVWTTYSQKYADFLRAYMQDLKEYGTVFKMQAKPNVPENTFPVSMIPWESFDSFQLHLQKGYGYLLPIFTFGKYTVQNQVVSIPLSIQVHHAVCDGFHVCRLVKELRELLDAWQTTAEVK